MSCFVYLLGSNGKGSYRTYVGWTTDLERRLAQHNAGKGARFTRGGPGSCSIPSALTTAPPP